VCVCVCVYVSVRSRAAKNQSFSVRVRVADNVDDDVTTSTVVSGTSARTCYYARPTPIARQFPYVVIPDVGQLPHRTTWISCTPPDWLPTSSRRCFELCSRFALQILVNLLLFCVKTRSEQYERSDHLKPFFLLQAKRFFDLIWSKLFELICPRLVVLNAENYRK